jgi:hypothetical protein
VTVAEQVAEVNGQLLPGPPKTEAGRRTVTLPAVAAVALAEHLTTFAEPSPEGLGLPGPTGRIPAPVELPSSLVGAGYTPAVALRYQHVMAGRDQAIAAALDELVQGAANLPPERPAEGPSGTLVARNQHARSEGPGRRAGRGR